MQIRVLLVGAQKSFNPIWQGAEEWEASSFDVWTCGKNDDVLAKLNMVDPDVIVTFGGWQENESLCRAPYAVRRRWIDLGVLATPEQAGLAILNCFVGLLEEGAQPLVSVFTPAYRDPKGIARAYQSLLAQTFTNWEWVIVDDSKDGGATHRAISQLPLSNDPRVRLHLLPLGIGKIGKVKRAACGLCTGHYLVELDHDDELTDGCLEELVRQFEAHPNAGMVWTDCAEVTEGTGVCHVYPDGWGFGFGSYRKELYKGKVYDVGQGPELNATTIKHIVGCPNHVRAWRASAYHALGGHNPNLLVCDDHDLIVRTWLKYDVIHSPLFGYIQYRKGTTGTVTRNAEIQRLTKWIGWHYSEQIEKRAKELQKK